MLKCRVCGELFDIKEGVAVFQNPHKSDEKPKNVFMCGNCGLNVMVYIKDLKKDFAMLKK